MATFKNFSASRWGIIGVGICIDIFAPLLQKWGNPGNMGICVACFDRDIAGALGLYGSAQDFLKAGTTLDAPNTHIHL
jgi:hypothetical protein